MPPCTFTYLYIPSYTPKYLSGLYQNRTGPDFTMIFRTGTDLSDRTGFSSRGVAQPGPPARAIGRDPFLDIYPFRGAGRGLTFFPNYV